MEQHYTAIDFVELTGLVVTVPLNNEHSLDFLSGGRGNHFLRVIRRASSFTGVSLVSTESSTVTSDHCRSKARPPLKCISVAFFFFVLSLNDKDTLLFKAKS